MLRDTARAVVEASEDRWVTLMSKSLYPMNSPGFPITFGTTLYQSGIRCSGLRDESYMGECVGQTDIQQDRQRERNTGHRVLTDETSVEG